MKSVFFISFLLITLTNSAFAKKCVTTTPKMTTISWTAFKTPLKIGVGGTFKDFKFTSKVEGSSVKDALYGQEVMIKLNAQSIHTKNTARNKKIAKFFFGHLKGPATIKARVVAIKEKVIEMQITMNGISRKVPMTYSILGNELKAKGVIDVLDFSMAGQLAALNKACFALHQGKTWSDVSIELTSEFSACH